MVGVGPAFCDIPPNRPPNGLRDKDLVFGSSRLSRGAVRPDAPTSRDRRLAGPGAVLTCDYLGRVVTVTVLDGGFEYAGQFATHTSIGRLTLKVLLSFAQFPR